MEVLYSNDVFLGSKRFHFEAMTVGIFLRNYLCGSHLSSTIPQLIGLQSGALPTIDGEKGRYSEDKRQRTSSRQWKASAKLPKGR